MPVMTRWKDEMYVTAYQLAREGHKDSEIAQTLGFGPEGFKTLLKRRPAVRDAIERGRDRATRSGGETFMDYAYRRLPVPLKAVWDRIAAADRQKNPEKLLDEITRDQGTRTMQWLWLHALAS